MVDIIIHRDSKSRVEGIGTYIKRGQDGWSVNGERKRKVGRGDVVPEWFSDRRLTGGAPCDFLILCMYVYIYINKYIQVHTHKKEE